MRKILICPGERAAVGFLAQTVPLVALPILGDSLVNCWMESLANSGFKQVLVLATDRPELVRSALEDGSRWGVRIQVQAELKELTADEVQARFQAEAATGGEDSCAPLSVSVIDHLPGFEELPLFRSYHDWFAAVLAWLSRAAALNRIGAHEMAPGIWRGQRTQLAPTARLAAPCWLGDHVQVGADAVIGPNAVLENRVVVDAAAEVQASYVGPDTFVGALTKLEGSIAWGNTLINWRTGSCTQVPDPFLLCALGQRYLPVRASRKPERVRRGFRRWLTLPFDFLAQFPGKSRP